MSEKPKSSLSRSVSIIGVGASKFGTPLDTPELKDMSLQDKAGWACITAMEDAGVNPRDIGKLIVGVVSSSWFNADTISPNYGLLEWIGMRGKASTTHNEGCATGMNCFNEAVDCVASGRYDIAICVDAENFRSMSIPTKPSCYIVPSSEYKDFYGHDPLMGIAAVETAYTRWLGASYITVEQKGRHYTKENGVTLDELEQGLMGAAVTARHHASRNPIAYTTQLWEDIAKSKGFDNVTDYFKSNYNPLITEYSRPAYKCVPVDGASAIIVCATDIAKKYKQQPIEIMDISQCDLQVMTPNVEMRLSRGVIEGVYEKTGYIPEDIEYLGTTDMDLVDAIDSAEVVGYLPKGEGWKYFRDGETRFDGSKPINTNGGAPGLGHGAGATPLHGVVECVLQMRGQAGERQIPKVPKVSMMRGQGATQSATLVVLRTAE